MRNTKVKLLLLTGVISSLMLSLTGCASKMRNSNEVIVPPLPANVIAESKSETTYYYEWQSLVLELRELLKENKLH